MDNFNRPVLTPAMMKAGAQALIAYQRSLHPEEYQREEELIPLIWEAFWRASSLEANTKPQNKQRKTNG